MTAIEDARRLPKEVRAEVEAQALSHLLAIVEEATLTGNIPVYAWLDGKKFAVHPEHVERIFSTIADKFVQQRERFSMLDHARAEAQEERRANQPLRDRVQVLEKNLRGMLRLIEHHLRERLEAGHYDPRRNPNGWSWRRDYDEALKALLPDGA